MIKHCFVSSLCFFFFQRYLPLPRSSWLRDRELSLVCLPSKGGSPCLFLVLPFPSPRWPITIGRPFGDCFSLLTAFLSIPGCSYRLHMRGAPLVRMTSGRHTITVEMTSFWGRRPSGSGRGATQGMPLGGQVLHGGRGE